MSCQLIRACDWDQMVQSGRVRGRVGPVPAPSLSAAPLPTRSGPGPDRLDELSDAELVLLLERVRAVERQLGALVAELTDELARHAARRPDGPVGGLPGSRG